MTERAYRAALALSAPGSGATPAERDNAAQRCREYEARHGRPEPARRHRPDEYPLDMRCTRCGWDFASHCTAQAKRVHWVVCDSFTPRAQRYANPVLCRHCNAQWAVHDIIDLYTTRCPGFQPTERPGVPPLWAVCQCGHTEACHYPSGVPKSRNCGGTRDVPGCFCLGFVWAPVPWWQLAIGKKTRRAVAAWRKAKEEEAERERPAAATNQTQDFCEAAEFVERMTADSLRYASDLLDKQTADLISKLRKRGRL